MSPRSIGLDQRLSDYVRAHSSPPLPTQSALIERTAALGSVAGMQISPEQGELLTTLTTLADPTLAVEIGTFTGYSALAIARGLGPAGRLLCCDVSEEWTKIAREHWAEAGLADRIELRIGPALATLQALPPDASVGFAFIDADKPSYVDYYEEVLARLAPGGVICVDNTLWNGRVADPDHHDDHTDALRRFNRHVADDPRTRQVLVPIGDGLTVIRRAP
ncbi:MAG: O-methyltransferase [Actinomycetota bacterium]